MVVSEDKHIIIAKKTIPMCIMALIFFCRFLKFYEFRGVTMQNGWSTVIHFKIFFLIAVIIFFIGVWFPFNHNIICIILQIISLIIMLGCEWLYMDFSELKTAYGFWINIMLSIVLLLYYSVVVKYVYTNINRNKNWIRFILLLFWNLRIII